MKDIFLCHTGADKDWVEELAKRLEEESIENRNITVWFDKWDIEGGANLLDKIEQGLKTSSLVGVVLSPAMTRAEWPKMEWQSQVYEDPAGRKARILPILRHQFDPVTGEPIEIPLPLRFLKRYDFTNPKRYEAELRELVRRIQGRPHPRGGTGMASPPMFVGQEEPTGGEESLLSNLLPSISVPEFLWSDHTTETDPGRIIEKTHPRSPFWVGDGQLHSFWPNDAPKNPFKSLLTGGLRRVHKTADWLAHPDKSRVVVQMFNRALRTHCFKLRLDTPKGDRDRDLFFCPVSGSQPRMFAWGPGGRGRTLAKMATGKDGTRFGVHHSAKLRFIVLGGAAYLLVQPGWFFTKDGSSPLDGSTRGVLSTQWGGRERNAAVLRNVLMWGLFLANRHPTIELRLGPANLKVGPVPVHSQISTSVGEDSVRLDRILGGGLQAGEVGAPGLVEADDEIDEIAGLQGSGIFELMAETLAESEDDSGADE